MKKHLIILILAFIGITFCGCTKSDTREYYVGNYNLNVQGTLTMKTPDGSKRSIIVNATDLQMDIEKNPSDKNGVYLKGYYEGFATIDKSSIYISPLTLIDTIDDIRMTLNITPEKGMLNAEGILTFDAAVTGTANYDDFSSEIEGIFHNAAVKH